MPAAYPYLDIMNTKHAALQRLFRPLCIAFIAGILFWINADAISVLAQEATQNPPAAPGAVASTPPPKSTTLLGLFREGGWIMWPLLIISMWCLALIIEGFIRIRLPNFAPADLVTQLKAAFSEENYQQAWRICKSRSSFLTNTLRHGLERIGRGRAACESAISEHGIKESMMFRTKISYLSTIGVISPMVGLLGTVTGMIKAFQALGHGGIADPSRLAAAIGEVLIATATGLFVAIPAFFLYYFFRNKLQQSIILAEDVMNQLMVDVKYEELQGIKIGDALEAELARGGSPPLGAGGMMPSEAEKRVSQAISGVTMSCPQCNGPITAGAPKCNTCGTELQWT
jgi:biopolymer transport protein ExbB